MNPHPLSSLQPAWPALSGLLDQALALPPQARDAWLAGLPPQHQGPLRALLATQAEIETSDFLADLPALRLPPSSVSAGGTQPPTGDAAPGLRVGAYRLIEQVGQGGMASVWRAEREDGLIRRPVALKLPAVTWGSAFAQRLAHEREILASLTHEHIARLYDAGIDQQGRPFLAMEYIEGEPIDQHCRTHRLPLDRRVDLLLQVLSAVAHAHSRLVVHRDLKPGNILVSAEGKVSLLDFGIAKLLQGDATQDTALTQAAGHALTPDYASPEQIRGEPLGTASDLYSLGVVAYELLAGERPYRLPRAGAGGLVRAIGAVKPPPASETAAAGPGGKALQRQLKGDLDAILQRAMKPGPDERYPSADAFAQDLQRWRQGEPVQARPDGLAYRAAKFVARHRAQVAAGALAVAALLAATGVALWQAREAREQAERARTEAATAQAVQRFLESIFSANSSHQDDPVAARQTTARDLLDRGAARIDSELADAPQAQLRLYQTLQEMYTHMALNDRVIALQRRSLALATRLYGPRSAEALGEAAGLAKTLLETNQREEARSLLLQTEAATRNVPGLPREALGLVYQCLAFLHLNEDPAQALAWARKAVALSRDQPVSPDTINDWHMLGETSLRMGHLQEAETALLAAEAQIRQHPEAGRGVLPLVLAALGSTQNRLGRPEAAGKTLQQALALARQAGEPYDLHNIGQKLSSWQTDNGLLHEAVVTAAADDAWGQTAGPDYGALPALLAARHARALVAWGDPVAALKVLARVWPQQPRLAPDLRAALLAMRADAQVATGQPDAAQADVQQAVALAGEHGAVAEEVRQVRRRLWLAQGRAAQALQDHRNDPLIAGPPPSPLAALRRRAEEARLLEAAGDAAAARTLAADGLAALQDLPERPFTRADEAMLAETLGRAWTRLGQPAQALGPLARAVGLRRELENPRGSPRLARALEALAEARQRLGDAAAAAGARAEAARLRAGWAATSKQDASAVSARDTPARTDR